MNARLFGISFLLGILGTGASWLTLQPVIGRLLNRLSQAGLVSSIDANLTFLLPVLLALDFVAVTFACFLILYLTVGRPLRKTESAIEELSRHNLSTPFASTGGPLLSRVESSLKRMAEALTEEQVKTKTQLAELQVVNARLKAAQTELVARERLATVGKLAAGIAHEVGNPLSGILGYLSLMRSRADQPQDVADGIRRIEDEVQRINQIVRGLLDLGRPQKLELLPVDLRALLDTCVKLVAASPELRELAVDLDVPPATLVRAEPGPLSQVLINLLLNAAQAMSGAGHIRLHTSQADGRVHLCVDDSGPGIAPEVQQSLFEPFVSTKGTRGGTGLGLAVSLHLVDAMQGQLRAENRPEGGARFTVSLWASAGT